MVYAYLLEWFIHVDIIEIRSGEINECNKTSKHVAIISEDGLTGLTLEAGQAGLVDKFAEPAGARSSAQRKAFTAEGGSKIR